MLVALTNSNNLHLLFFSGGSAGLLLTQSSVCYACCADIAAELSADMDE